MSYRAEQPLTRIGAIGTLGTSRPISPFIGLMPLLFGRRDSPSVGCDIFFAGRNLRNLLFTDKMVPVLCSV